MVTVARAGRPAGFCAVGFIFQPSKRPRRRPVNHAPAPARDVFFAQKTKKQLTPAQSSYTSK
jgi:hypothetical protein